MQTTETGQKKIVKGAKATSSVAPLKTQSTVNLSRAQVSSEYKPLGIRPYFYTTEELAVLDRLVKWSNLDVKWDKHKLHSLFPEITLAAYQDSPIVYEKYGWTRMSPAGFILRPHMNGVVSCLTFSESAYAYAGNFGYLNHPAWACYMCFGTNATPLSFGDWYGYGKSNLPIKPEELGYTQPLMTANVMYCYDEQGYRSANIALIKGNSYDAQIRTATIRLARYLRSVLNLKVYCSGYSIPYGAFRLEKSVMVRTPPLAQQFLFSKMQKAGKNQYPGRSSDTAFPSYKEVGKTVLICESQTAGYEFRDEDMFNRVEREHLNPPVQDAAIDVTDFKACVPFNLLQGRKDPKVKKEVVSL